MDDELELWMLGKRADVEGIVQRYSERRG
jgi:hypothetical protein